MFWQVVLFVLVALPYTLALIWGLLHVLDDFPRRQ